MLVFALMLLAQQAEPPQLGEVVEVRIINLDVIVTDRSGNRIVGLGREDFEVFEDGVAQIITNFSEIVPPAELRRRQGSGSKLPWQVETAPPRKIVFFVDTLTTHPFQRKRLARAIEEFLGTALDPQDEVMVLTWNRRLKMIVAPTSDVSQVRQALKEISSASSAEGGSAVWTEAFRPQTRAQMRMYARRMERDLQQAVAAVRGVLQRFTGVGGRKVLVLITEGFAMRPGAELLEQDPGAVSAPEAPGVEALDAEGSGPLFDSAEESGPRLIQSLVRHANAAGVTIYPIHAAGLTSGMTVEQSSANAMAMRQRAMANSVESLTLMANETGGFVVANSNDFQTAIRRVGQEASAFYSIGYRAGREDRDRERRIEVRVRNPEFIVRSRRSLVEKSADSDTRDQVLTNLYFPARANDLGIGIRTGKPKREKDKIRIAIDVLIPLESLTFQPGEESYIADLAIFIASSGSEGTVSSVRRLSHRVAIPREKIGKVPGQHYTYSIDLDLATRSRENRVSVAVLDNLSKASGYATIPLPVPD